MLPGLNLTIKTTNFNFKPNNARKEGGLKMSKCQWYKVHVKHIKSRENLPDHQVHNVQIDNRPWCSHKHSPVSLRVAISVMRGSGLLKCEGDMGKCPLSETEFSDT